MLYTFELQTKAPAIVDITDRLEEAIRSAEVERGVCVVTVEDPCVSLAFLERGNENVGEDILNEFNILVPPRIDYKGESDPYIAAARTKAALTVGSKEVIISNGLPRLAFHRGLFVVDFVGGKSITINMRSI